MPKPTEHPVDNVQLQASTAAIPTDEAVGDEGKHPNSSPIYFPPSDPFESDDEDEVPTASMAVSEPHQSDRGTVTAVTSARKSKYSGQKNSGTTSEAAESSHIKETIHCYREEGICGKEDSQI